jgi:CDP-diacylglycerol--serine O-phosphatidyltransferase
MSLFLARYHRSLLLTHIGVTIAVIGIGLAITGHIREAIICLIAAGAFDLLDGPVARHTKRTRHEQLVGIQVDSLADIVAFAALPVVIFSSLGYNSWYHLAAYALLVIAGITRLSHFNIAATTEPLGHYTGLPVTSTALIFPVVYLLSRLFQPDIFNLLLLTLFTLTAVAFVANFRFPKPRGVAYLVVALIAGVVTTLVVTAA